jgi:hypothetical protein
MAEEFDPNRIFEFAGYTPDRPGMLPRSIPGSEQAFLVTPGAATAADYTMRTLPDGTTAGYGADDGYRVHAWIPDQLARGEREFPLEELIQHEKLFAAYPWLREMTVRFDPKIPHRGEYYGRGHPRAGSISLGGDKVDLETLMHEITHAIRDRYNPGMLNTRATFERAYAAAPRSQPFNAWFYENYYDAADEALAETVARMGAARAPDNADITPQWIRDQFWTNRRPGMLTKIRKPKK